MTLGARLTLIGMLFCCVSLVGGRLGLGPVNLAAVIVGYPLVIVGAVRLMAFEGKD